MPKSSNSCTGKSAANRRETGGRPRFFLITVCCVLIVSTDGAQLKQTRRVLILNDLAIVASPGYAEIDQAVYDGLQNSPYQIELYHESLQLTAFQPKLNNVGFESNSDLSIQNASST